MSAALERVIAGATDDLAKLKVTLETNKQHHAAVFASDFVQPTTTTLLKHQCLPFSSLEKVLKIAEELGQELVAVRAEVQQSDITLAELQSKMLKSKFSPVGARNPSRSERTGVIDIGPLSLYLPISPVPWSLTLQPT